MTFIDYVKHGWSLCYIHDGEKRPRGAGWNSREKAITDTRRAGHLVNGGLMHAYSGTCAIDIDNFDLARLWLQDRGIDLDAIFSAPDAAQIVSGDNTRGKLIYALPEPLPTKQLKNDDKTVMVLELRCGATTGRSAQDVLPPSTNPRTGKPYAWKYNSPAGNWQQLPPLPEPLRELWLSMLAPAQPERTAHELQPTARVEELRALIADRSPDLSYDEWCKIGMILHHETEGGEDGLAIWDEWSQGGGKYVGIDDLESHWQSFGSAANPATAGSLRRESVATDDAFGEPLSEDLLVEAERATRKTFKLIPASQFALCEPVRYLVDGMIEAGQLFGFIGRRKGGKTYAALDLAFAIAQGRPWAKRAVHETGRVVWIAAEGARSMQIRRLPQWLAQYGDADILFWPHSLNMRNADTYRGLVECCTGAKLVVIDSLRRVTPGAKENSSDEFTEVLAYAEQLTRETGAAVCFIAHAGKTKAEGDEMTARGTSAIEDALEAGFFIEKLEGEAVADVKFRVTPGFARDEETGDSSAFFFGLTPVSPAGMAPGVLVNWEVEKPKPKQSEAPKVSTSMTLAVQVIDSLWPVDGEPVIQRDAFLGAYSSKLSKPDGQDNRITKAHTALNALATRGIVEIDEQTNLVTLLRSALLDRAKADTAFGPPVNEDPDGDLL